MQAVMSCLDMSPVTSGMGQGDGALQAVCMTISRRAGRAYDLHTCQTGRVKLITDLSLADFAGLQQPVIELLDLAECTPTVLNMQTLHAAAPPSCST